MPNVTNELYSDFLGGKFFKIITKDRLRDILKQVQYKDPRYNDRARAFMIVLYYSTHRPSEILDLKWEDVIVYDEYVELQFDARKRGRASRVFINKDSVTEELWKFFGEKKTNFDLMYVFFPFRSRVKKKVEQKGGGIREYEVNSANIYYWVKKWTRESGMCLIPYYFRHDGRTRFVLAGGNVSSLAIMGGAADERSVSRYHHYSVESAKQGARIMQDAP